MAIPSAASMLDPTTPNLIGVLLGIALLKAIAPASLLYTLLNCYRYFALDTYTTWLPLLVLQAYCAAESLFFLFFLAYRIHLQAEAVHPPLRTKADRQAQFEKSQSQINDTERFITGWFKGADIKDIGKDGLRDFLNWSFWEGRAGPEDEEELQEYVRRSQEMAGVELKEHGPARPLRLTMDPVKMDYRSLLWYGIIVGLDLVASLAFWEYGFQYYGTSWSSPIVFPPRPASLYAHGVSPSKQLSYWIRPHNSKTRTPVLFLHGVGIGLQAYVDFLHLLDLALNKNAAADDTVGILALEFMPISSRLTHPVPKREEFNRQLLEILDKHGFDQVVLVNHSYGSIASSHILTDDAMAARVSAVLTIDPVTILLHLPDVAFNFTIRAPRVANEWQLWYFASKDPGIAHTLGRHLFWYESVLWRDRVMELVDRGMHFTASLSRRDLIVDTPAVGRYLMKNDKPDPVVQNGKRKTMTLKSQDEHDDSWQNKEWTGEGLEVLWWPDYDHAQVMDYTDSRAKLIDVVCQYSKGSRKRQ